MLALALLTACAQQDEPATPEPAPEAAPAEPSPGLLVQDATERTPESDPLLSTRKPLVPGPKPIATGGRAVDQLAWAGWRLVGADAQGSSSVLLLWDDPEQAPRELARIPGRVQGLTPAPDGRRVALEAAYPVDPGIWSLDDPASLLVLELDTGRVRTLVGATRGATLRGACWSPDSTRLAIPSFDVKGAHPSRAMVRVLDTDTGTTVTETDPALELEPMRWTAQGLELRRSDPLGKTKRLAYRWQPGEGNPQPIAGIRWPSPDGRFTVQAVPGGLEVRQGGGAPTTLEPVSPRDAEALATWSRTGRPAWCGTHHLAIQVADEVLALDLSQLRWRPLAPVGAGPPRVDRSGHRLILQAGAEPWWGWAP
jgi:hypothetical protein